MTPRPTPEPDDLSKLFVSRPKAETDFADAAAGADRLTLLRTLAVVRRHGIKRRMAVGVAIAFIAIASFGVGRITAPRAVGSGSASESDVPMRGIDQDRRGPSASNIESRDSASLTLFDRDIEEAARILKQRGDRLLYEQSDLGGALECYRQHLEIKTSTRTLRAEVDDSWLLAKLKDAHLEKRP